MDYTLKLNDGTELPGTSPIVVLGPNGSGKTRSARSITSAAPISFINALRNTRVSPQIPAMGVSDARTNYTSQKNQAKSQHWELTSDFDYLLSRLLAEKAMLAMEFETSFRKDPKTSLPPLTALGRVERIWGDVFPGRELLWKDWAPMVRSGVGDSVDDYTANQMSDGEKAVLYLAGKVFSEEPGIIVIDEPEMHLHSLLAIQLWNALESARTDLRFVYITHDLTFALSRPSAQFVLASPKEGLKVLDMGGELPGDVAEILLGAASLSFYARRVVFCEGSETSIDNEFYNAWFRGYDTVVRSVGSSQMVMRCIAALSNSGVANSLQSQGIIDRDFHPSEFIESLNESIHILPIHEVESLLCLPHVVGAVAKHLGREFDTEKYRTDLGNEVSASDRDNIIIERWKRRLGPNLEGLVSTVSTRRKSIDDVALEIPKIFDHTAWSFSPIGILTEEKERIESAIPHGTIETILDLAPGKKFVSLAARAVGMQPLAYRSLIIGALAGDTDDELGALSQELDSELRRYLPPRAIGREATVPAVTELA